MTRNGAVFAVCLLVAVLLLLLNKLSRNYIGDVKGSIHYAHLPEGKAPTAPLPAELNLFIETTGFRLIWSKMKKPPTIRIDLSALKTSYLATSELKSLITSQISPDYHLVAIAPDTLYFNFDKGIQKKVPVIPDIVISFKKQFDFTEPMIITPDSILVSGPQNVVDTIEGWRTKRLVFENLDKSIQAEVPLIAPPSHSISITPDKIKYVIPVEEYTEKTLEVTAEIINIPGKREINIYPNKVQVIFRVGLSNYEHVSAENFRAAADFAGVDIKRSKYVPVKILQSPSFIKNLDYSPKSVEFIIYR